MSSTRPSASRRSGSPPLASVYLGGGTPSLLPPDEVERVLARVRDRFGLASDAEITIESNPGPDERGDPRALRSAGVTRMSFGAQSFDDRELRRLGRRHRAQHVAEAVADARDAGIRSINIDLLYDIPDAGLATWMATLDAALAVEPDHLSLYALTLDDPDAEGLTGPVGDHLPTTKGARRWRDAARPGQDEDRAAGQYHHAAVDARRRRLSRLRDLELGAAGAREPAQPRVLATPAARGARTGRARVRWPDATMDGSAARWIRRGAGGSDAGPATGRRRGARRGDRRGRVGDPRAAAGHRRAAARRRTSRPSPIRSAGPSPPSC